MSILGENIKRLRTNIGMTIEDLSNKSGVGKSTISEIESGKAKNPRSETLIKLSSVLNVSMNYLTDMEVDKEYVVSDDIEEALLMFLDQKDLYLDGKLLVDEARWQLINSVKMGLQFARETQERINKEK